MSDTHINFTCIFWMMVLDKAASLNQGKHMKKEILDTVVQDEHTDTPSTHQPSISEELQKAIEMLIYRMRERGQAERF